MKAIVLGFAVCGLSALVASSFVGPTLAPAPPGVDPEVVDRLRDSLEVARADLESLRHRLEGMEIARAVRTEAAPAKALGGKERQVCDAHCGDLRGEIERLWLRLGMVEGALPPGFPAQIALAPSDGEQVGLESSLAGTEGDGVFHLLDSKAGYFLTKAAGLSRARMFLSLHATPQLRLDLGENDGDGRFELIFSDTPGVVVPLQEESLFEKIEIPR